MAARQPSTALALIFCFTQWKTKNPMGYKEQGIVRVLSLGYPVQILK